MTSPTAPSPRRRELTRVVVVRFNPETYTELEAAAAEAGQDVSKLVRAAVTSHLAARWAATELADTAPTHLEGELA